MSLLTNNFEDQFEFKDEIYTIDMSYDNILLLFEMFDDKELEDYEKVYLALKMLINEYDELNLETQEESYDLFKFVLFEFLEIDLDREKETSVKVYDFKKDDTLIYASFYASYKIDLVEEKGKLHWKKFMALFSHLDDNSAFKQVVGYRVMKIPSEQEASKDYRNHVIKMKQLYSLNDEPQDATSVFDALAKVFKSNQ